MTTTSNNDRRSASRRAVKGLKLYLDNQDLFLGWVVEVSKTGLRVEGRIPVPVGVTHWFRLESHEAVDAGLPLYLSAAARHVEQLDRETFASGIAFEETNGAQRTALERLVAALSP